MNIELRRAKVLWVGILVSLWSAPVLAADHGRFLPEVPNLYDEWEWSDEDVVEFNQDVICPDIGKIGEIRFTYDTYVALEENEPGEEDDVFPTGAALAGGFWLTEECEFCGGNYQWGWVQIVRSTFSNSESVWSPADGEWYPDTDGIQDPDYPFETLPVSLETPPDPAPTIGFQDFPARSFTGGDQFWQAELGLVCKDLANATMKIVSTFLWGFDLQVTGPPEGQGVQQLPPGFWSDATPNYINTLTSHFSGLNGSTQWQVDRGCCCCEIPEPASLSLACFGLMAVMFAKRRGMKGKAAA
jgi:hypothetical protein